VRASPKKKQLQPTNLGLETPVRWHAEETQDQHKLLSSPAEAFSTMTTRAIIPRFLLPLQGPLWRGISIPLSQNSIRIRFASSSTEKPIVLEKPARFNPPSHGSRAKRNHVPKHYGPDLTAAEIAAQNAKNYPGMMAPEGTWAHFFWHSRILHTFITMVR
jgi:hypothetical protein